MRVSCHTSFYLNYQIEEVFHRLSDLGYEGVEISALSESGTFTPQLLNERRIKKIKNGAKNLGLKIVTYDCELLPSFGRNLVSFDSTVRDYTANYIISAVDTAKKLGTKFLVISAGMVMYGNTKREAREWLIEKLKECTQYAEARDIYLLLEHTTMLEGNMVVTMEDLRSVLEDVNSNYLLPLVDAGHVIVNGESFTNYIMSLKDKIKHIHIDDNDGKIDDHLPPGMGIINFDTLFRALKKIDYSGFLSVEPSFSFSDDPDTAALMALRFIQDKLVNLEN